MLWRLALAAILAAPAQPATKLLVTVIEQKTGKPVTDLKAEDFTVRDGSTQRRVEAAEFSQRTMDVMLLLDTSLVGEMVQPLALNLIEQLQPKEQMAIVSFHSSADLIQDFTSSRDLLRQSIAGIKYGNTPRVLDALYAAIDGGFQSSIFRRVVLLLTTGAEGNSRVSERDVVRLARRNGVSIFPVYMIGYERSMFERLARQTGGACFNVRDMSRSVSGPPGPRIFEVMRSHYTLTLSGNLAPSDKLRIEAARPGKLLISALPLE